MSNKDTESSGHSASPSIASAPIARDHSDNDIHGRTSSLTFHPSTPPFPRNRSFPAPRSPLNPSRSSPWGWRDSAFAPPPSRDATLYAESVGPAKPMKTVRTKSTALKRGEDGKIHIEKPWLQKKDPYVTISAIVTYAFMFLGNVFVILVLSSVDR